MKCLSEQGALKYRDGAEMEGNSMLMDIIKARHSIRKYTDVQISRRDLELILERAILRPMPEADSVVCWWGYGTRN